MDDALFAQIAATPDAIDPYLVLADQLQQRQDPRGDLIVVQRALESATGVDEADLRKREGEALLAHLAEWYPIDAASRKALAVRWRWGFIHRAGSNHAPALASLLKAPHVGSTLVELQLEPSYANNFGLQFSELVAAWPHSLRRLTLEGFMNDSLTFGEAIAMPAAGSPLEALCLRARAVRFAAPPPPSLKKLEIRSPAFELASLGTFKWPSLEELVIETESVNLALDVFPNLRRLALRGTVNTDELVERLLEHPILGQLTHLDLFGGTLTEAGAKLLEQLREHMQLELGQNLIRRVRGVGHQRQGVAPLERAKLARSAAKACSGGADLVKQFVKAQSFASAAGPLAAFNDRTELAGRLEGEAQLAAYSALHTELETELRPDHNDHLLQLLQHEALAHGKREHLVETETAQWLVLRQANWIERSYAVTTTTSHIASLRMKRGDAASAAPIFASAELAARAKKDRRGEAAALRQRGNAELTRSNFVEGERHYRAALAIYEELGLREDQGIVLSELASAYWYRHDLAGAEAMLRQAIEMQPRDSLGTASTYCNLGAILNGANRADDAIEATTHALALFEQHKHRGGQGQALALLGELWQRKIQPTRALELLDRALAIERETGRKRELGVTLGNVSRVALDLGDWQKARECCEEAIEIHRECGNKYNEGMQLLGLGDAAIGENELVEADAHYFDALIPLKEINSYIAISAVRLRRGIVAQLLGKREPAAKFYRDAAADAVRGHDAEMPGWIDMWVALLAAQAGDRRAAITALDRARTSMPATSVQGTASLAMTAAVVTHLLGEKTAIPEPCDWDTRIISRLAQ